MRGTIHHLDLTVKDPWASQAFYDAVLGFMGYRRGKDDPHGFDYDWTGSGPFTSVGKVRELLDFVRNNIQLRTCKLNLSQNNIRKGKFKVCLEYHLGNCKGPCEGFQTEADYQEGLVQLKNILKGNLGPLVQGFKKEMKELAESMNFEKAEIIRKGSGLGLDYGLTHSCYDPLTTGSPCRHCDSCLLRAKGFLEAGVVDPLLLR